MERLTVVNECYQKWWDLQCKVNDFYSEKERRRPPLSQQKEFRAIKNAVIQEAERIRQNQISFEDMDMEDGGGWWMTGNSPGRAGNCEGRSKMKNCLLRNGMLLRERWNS